MTWSNNNERINWKLTSLENPWHLKRFCSSLPWCCQGIFVLTFRYHLAKGILPARISFSVASLMMMMASPISVQMVCFCPCSNRTILMETVKDCDSMTDFHLRQMYFHQNQCSDLTQICLIRLRNFGDDYYLPLVYSYLSLMVNLSEEKENTITLSICFHFWAFIWVCYFRCCFRELLSIPKHQFNICKWKWWK